MTSVDSSGGSEMFDGSDGAGALGVATTGTSSRCASAGEMKAIIDRKIRHDLVARRREQAAVSALVPELAGRDFGGRALLKMNLAFIVPRSRAREIRSIQILPNCDRNDAETWLRGSHVPRRYT